MRLLSQNNTFFERVTDAGGRVKDLGRGLYHIGLKDPLRPELIWQTADASGAVIIGLEEQEEGFEAAFLGQLETAK